MVAFLRRGCFRAVKGLRSSVILNRRGWVDSRLGVLVPPLYGGVLMKKTDLAFWGDLGIANTFRERQNNQVGPYCPRTSYSLR